jgi:hypothetical protein
MQNSLIAVLHCATLKVSATSVSQDGEEECWVEERDWGIQTSRESPHEGLRPVGRVILPVGKNPSLLRLTSHRSTYRLPGVSPPTAGQQLVTVFGLNVSRILDNGSRQLGE